MQPFPTHWTCWWSASSRDLALPQSIDRVAEEMAVSHSELAEELALVNAEIRAGIPSTEALRHLADRTGLEDVNGLVSLLAQSIRFGTSIADTLRIYAEEFRDRRTQAAEEQAAKLGTKSDLSTSLLPVAEFLSGRYRAGDHRRPQGFWEDCDMHRIALLAAAVAVLAGCQSTGSDMTRVRPGIV